MVSINIVKTRRKMSIFPSDKVTRKDLIITGKGGRGRGRGRGRSNQSISRRIITYMQCMISTRENFATDVRTLVSTWVN